MLSRLASSAGLLSQLATQIASSSGSGAGSAALQHAAAATSRAAQQWGSALRPQQQAGFATNSHDIFNVHKDSPDNNVNVPFEFAPATMKKVRACLPPASTRNKVFYAASLSLLLPSPPNRRSPSA